MCSSWIDLGFRQQVNLGISILISICCGRGRKNNREAERGLRFVIE
jgi:hypothetical protein